MAGLTAEAVSAVVVAAVAVLTGLAALLRVMYRVARAVDEVNHAVNHQPEEAPVLVERVRNLEAMNVWKIGALQVMAEHIGVALPPPPAPANVTVPKGRP